MQNSCTFERSRSFTNLKLHPVQIVLVIAAVIVFSGCGGGAASTANPTPPSTPNPAPTISMISPNSVTDDNAAFTLTINGTNFVAASMVNFGIGGAAPATTFVNSAQLTAAIPAASIASPGVIAVSVTNPAPGGGTSNFINFSITNGPVPTINSIFPDCVPAGEQLIDSTDNLLTVGGLNFVTSSVVRWNGSDLPTTFENSNPPGTILSAQIPASDIASAGTATVTVFNPGPGAGSSNPLTFTITAGAVDPQSIAVDPAGKFAYVASAGCDFFGYVSMYTITPPPGP